MIHIKLYLLLAALCACCSYGLSSNVTPPPKPIIIPIPVLSKEDKPAEAAAPQPTDVKPAATEPPTAATEPPTTDAEKPHPKPHTTTSSTTTSTTTTTTSTTTTTTPPPTPKPTPPPPPPTPAPTPAPGPLPPPEQGTWSLNNTTNNVTCIVIQFAAQLNVTYTKVVENVTSLANVLLNVPSNASVIGGECGAEQQSIILSWLSGTSNITNTMTLTYHKNDTTKTYALKSLEVALSPDLFVNASVKAIVTLSHGTEWSTPLATSYRCAPPTRYNMTSDAGVVAALTLAHLQEEAFRTTNGTAFSAGRECAGGDVPDAVPIAVGCALGGLVLVVLIAYLVGRRRSTSGYLSM